MIVGSGSMCYRDTGHEYIRKLKTTPKHLLYIPFVFADLLDPYQISTKSTKPSSKNPLKVILESQL